MTTLSTCTSSKPKSTSACPDRRPSWIENFSAGRRTDVSRNAKAEYEVKVVSGSFTGSLRRGSRTVFSEVVGTLFHCFSVAGTSTTDIGLCDATIAI
ncbi:hypothetical protein CaCOL14_010405 [Colletotrichum acutatum]